MFGQVVVPGAMFATMAVTVLWGERARSVVLEDCQLHSPMIVPQEDPEDEAGEGGRKLQIVFDGADGPAARRFEVFSRGSEEGWTLHLEGRMSPGGRRREAAERVDLEDLRGEPDGGRRRIALPQQGEHPGGARARVSPPEGRLVRPERSARRGGAPRLSRRGRPRPASDSPRRLFSDRARGARPGPRGGEVHLHALRLGPAVAGGAAARTDLLPCPHARGGPAGRIGGDRGRLPGGRQGRSQALLRERGAARRRGRVHDEAGDAGRHAPRRRTRSRTSSTRSPGGRRP